MDNNNFELFLKTCGTEKLAGSILGITQPHISQIRNGYRRLSYEKALIITEYLNIKLGKTVNPLELISVDKKNRFNLSKTSLFSNVPIRYIKIDLHKIILTNTRQSSNYKKEKSIIIDEFNFLIANEETYYANLKNNKKIAEGWEISLQKLVNAALDASIVAYISNTFDLIERTKLAQRCESLAGNRRGKPFKKSSKVENSPHLVLPAGTKTRDFVAKLFNLGSDHTYRTIKQIIAHGDQELIEQIRYEEITPHAAYQKILTIEPSPSFSFRF